MHVILKGIIVTTQPLNSDLYIHASHNILYFACVKREIQAEIGSSEMGKNGPFLHQKYNMWWFWSQQSPHPVAE